MMDYAAEQQQQQQQQKKKKKKKKTKKKVASLIRLITCAELGKHVTLCCMPQNPYYYYNSLLLLLSPPANNRQESNNSSVPRIELEQPHVSETVSENYKIRNRLLDKTKYSPGKSTALLCVLCEKFHQHDSAWDRQHLTALKDSTFRQSHRKCEGVYLFFGHVCMASPCNVTDRDQLLCGCQLWHRPDPYHLTYLYPTCAARPTLPTQHPTRVPLCPDSHPLALTHCNAPLCPKTLIPTLSHPHNTVPPSSLLPTPLYCPYTSHQPPLDPPHPLTPNPTP